MPTRRRRAGPLFTIARPEFGKCHSSRRGPTSSSDVGTAHRRREFVHVWSRRSTRGQSMRLFSGGRLSPLRKWIGMGDAL